MSLIKNEDGKSGYHDRGKIEGAGYFLVRVRQLNSSA